MRSFEQFMYSRWAESALPIDDAVPDAPDPRQPIPTMRLVRQPLVEPILYDPIQKPQPLSLVNRNVLGKKKTKEALTDTAAVASRLKKVPGGSVSKGTFTPKQHLNIPRKEMPQLKDREEFIHWLQSQGINVKIEQIPAVSLIRNPSNKEKLVAHAQSQIYVQKAAKFIQRDKLLDKLIVLSSDGVIFDGNHHWYALMAYKKIRKTPVPMYVVDMPFDELKQFVVDHCPGVTFEEMNSGNLWN
jgi:hypothetical protein